MKLKSICHGHWGSLTTHGGAVTESNRSSVRMPTKDRKAKPGPTQPETIVAVACVSALSVLSVTWHGGKLDAAVAGGAISPCATTRPNIATTGTMNAARSGLLIGP